MKTFFIAIASITLAGSSCPSDVVVPQSIPQSSIENSAPIATLDVVGSPIRSGVNTSVSLFGNWSHDDDGDSLTYEWTVDGEHLSGSAITSWVGDYLPGVHTVSLTVCDAYGTCDSKSTQIARRGPKAGRWIGSVEGGGSIEFVVDAWDHVGTVKFIHTYNVCSSESFPVDIEITGGTGYLAGEWFDRNESIFQLHGHFEVDESSPIMTSATGVVSARRDSIFPDQCSFFAQANWTAEWVSD